MTYHYDVVVIGAGPAGLSAAIRLRWVKGYQPMPSSVVLVDPQEPGGLAALGGCVLTGPNWAMDAQGILEPLLKDQAALAIPQIRERAVDIQKKGPLFYTTLKNGRVLTSLAVIVATGFRALVDEAKFFGRGLYLTYKGYAFFPKLLEQAAKAAQNRGLVIVGNRHTLDQLPLLEGLQAQAGGLSLLLYPPMPSPLPTLPTGAQIIEGRLETLVGTTNLQAITYQGANDEPEAPPKHLEAGAVFIDYYAFESEPEPWGCKNLPRGPRGFFEVDSQMASPIPGLFAAGDITGRYASTAMALGDGICAAFSALNYIHPLKYGVEPHLFAYAATGPSPGLFADPERLRRPFALPAEGQVVALIPEAKFNAQLHEMGLTPLPYQRPTLRELATLWQRSAEEIEALVFQLLFRRSITLHHLLAGSPRVKTP